MPNQPLLPKPGVNTQQSPLLLGMGWAQSQLIRFKDGLIQILGGCSRLTSQTFIGTCRGLRPFYDLAGNTYIGIGTTDRLQVLTNGSITDITPSRATSNLTNPLATTAGSSIVTVTDGAFLPGGLSIGDWVSIETASSIGGLYLQGIYPVVAVGGGTWQFDAGSLATSTVAAGGAVIEFDTTIGSHTVVITQAGYTFTSGQTISIAVSTTVAGITLFGSYAVLVSGGIASIASPVAASATATAQENGGEVRVGYLLGTAVESPGSGFGTYGSGTYGTGPFGVGMVPPPIGGWQRQWSLDAWGQDLIANPTDGAIYVWTPPVATGNPAVVIPQAPAESVGCFVTSPSQQIMAFGCTDPITGNQDPLLLRFCDVADYTDWTASATNQAGSFRLSSGSLIMGAIQAPGQILIWTDLDLWVGQYIGFPLVYGFNRIGQNCGLRAKRGMVALGGAVFWIGQSEFYIYDGQAVQALPCTVWDFIFENIDLGYPGSVHLGGDSRFGEWFCYFPTPGSNGQANAYVKYNLQGQWDCGFLARSAWYDQSVAGNPVASDYTGLLQAHESSPDLDGMSMDAWAQTGWMALAEGAQFISLQRLLVDFIVTGTEQLLVTVFLVDYIDGSDAPRQYGPYPVTASTRYVWVRGRGRYAAVKIESNAHGIFWRLGKIEAVLAADGRR